MINRNSLKFSRIFLVNFALVALIGCKPLVDLSKAGLRPPSQEDHNSIAQLYLKEQRNLDKPAPETAIVISGGGMRSALFSIGTLKALYDGNPNFFRDVDMISTVSGGSYASYWIYSNEITAATKNGSDYKFGEASFKDASYDRNLFLMNRYADMYPIRRIGRAVLGRVNLVGDYEDRIHRTFGQGNRPSYLDPHGKKSYVPIKPTFNDLQIHVRRKDVPYPIFNSSILSKVDREFIAKNPARIFEFTATHAGNSYMEVEAPIESFGKSTLSRAVAISGAAVEGPLHQRYLNWTEGYPKKWTLADGGRNENLGAVSAARRGVKRMIILDGEHSPDYEFDAYKHLRTNLDQIGMRVCIPEIDAIMSGGYSDHRKRLSTGVFRGTIRPKSIHSKFSKTIDVFYLKMSYPEDVRQFDGTFEVELKKKEDERWDDLFLDKNGNQSARIHEVHGEKPALLMVESYTRYLHRSKWRWLGGAAAYRFPQITTAEQNWGKPDKMGAMLSLGYLQGIKLDRIYSASRKGN